MGLEAKLVYAGGCGSGQGLQFVCKIARRGRLAYRYKAAELWPLELERAGHSPCHGVNRGAQTPSATATGS